MAPVLAAAGLDVRAVQTHERGHAGRLAAGVPVARCDMLVLVGGDGTVFDALQARCACPDPGRPAFRDPIPGCIQHHKGPGVGHAGGEVRCKLPGWDDCPGPRRESCLACPMQVSCLACLSEGWGGVQEQAGAAVWHQRDTRPRTTSAGSSLQNPTSRGPACACETLADFMWCCCSWVGLTPRPGRPRASCTGRTGRRPRGCRYARSPAAAATRSPPTAACGPLRRPRTPSARSVRRRRARPPAHARRCSLAAPATFMVHAVVIQSKCLYQYVCLYVLWVPGMLAVPVLCSQTRRMLGGSRERCA